MDDLRTKLVDEVVNEVEILGEMKVGTDEFTATVNGVTKLMDKLNEMDKISNDNEIRVKNLENEKELKLKELEIDKKDRIVKNVITGVTTVGGIAVTVWGTVKAFEFEKFGTITTKIGNMHFGNITKLFKR